MQVLSIFVDESGDFGEYANHAPYYIVTMLSHDQSVDVSSKIKQLDNSLIQIMEIYQILKNEFFIRKEI